MCNIKIEHGEKHMNVMLNKCAIIQQMTIFELPCSVCIYLLNCQHRSINITLVTTIKCTCYDVIEVEVVVEFEVYCHNTIINNYRYIVYKLTKNMHYDNEG